MTYKLTEIIIMIKNIPSVQNYPNLVVFKVLLKKGERGLRIC